MTPVAWWRAVGAGVLTVHCRGACVVNARPPPLQVMIRFALPLAAPQALCRPLLSHSGHWVLSCPLGDAGPDPVV